MGLPLFPFLIDHKYQATKLLGKGGGGFAVLARHKNKEVAVKLLNLTLVKDAERGIQKFKKEFLTLKKLRHTHIGALYDFGFDPELNFYYFVGEYIQGQDVNKACQQLSLEQIEKLFVQALQALHYLHTFGRAGLRHNDIKAANILVMTDDKNEPALKLIDFGLTSMAPFETRGGTASTMAPEQILVTFPDFIPGKKMPKPDLRADLYSLGVVWYFCLTGKNPFLVERDTDSTLKRHFGYVPPAPSTLRAEIPRYFDTILLKLLKENPEERYSSAAEVIQDLRYLSRKPYSVIPKTLRHYYLPEGEWIGDPSVLKTFQEKWAHCIKIGEPHIIWVIGQRGQGKSKVLEHFKNYVQSHDGHFLFAEAAEEIEHQTKDFSKKLVIAVDESGNIEELINKVVHARHWEKSAPIPWLFVFTADHPPTFSSPLPATTLHLKNFDLKDLKELVKRISPKKNTDPPEPFLKKLHDHTDGNPLFVTAILQALGEKGLLWNDDGAWSPSLFQTMGIDFGRLAIPKDLNKIFARNWKICMPAEKEFLKRVSCFQNGAPYQEGFERLLDLGFLFCDSKNRFRFKNPFFQKTVGRALTPTEKRGLHATIAEDFKKQKKPPHEIAYHLSFSGNAAVRAKALETLAEFYTATGRLEEALEARKNQNHFNGAIQTCRLLARLHRFREGEVLIKKWLNKIPRSPKYKGWQAAFLREQGMIFLLDRKPDKARTSFEKALGILEKVKGHLKEKLILKNTIARTWLEERKIDQAIAIYTETRKAGLEILNNDLGYAYLLNQDTQNTIPCLEDDLKFLEKAGDKMRKLRCHFLLGSAFRKLKKDFPSAIKHYHACSHLARDAKDNDWLMRALNGLAATYLDNNEYKQALRYFEESLSLCRQLKKDLSTLDCETAAIVLNIGNVHQEMGNLSKAHDAFQTILTVLEEKPKKESREMSSLCETYIALADNLSAQKNYQAMLSPIQKAWEIAKQSKSFLEHQLGLQILWAEWARATDNFDQLKEHLGLAEALQSRYHLHPTPMAKKRLEKLKADCYCPQLFPKALFKSP